MVMMLVTCTGCHKSGVFDIRLEFNANHDQCGKCGHDQARKWHFQFCLLSCFLDWMKRENVADVGFPCQDCIDRMETGKPSGFAYGFQQNGVCKICDGKKAVKGRLVAVDPLAEIEKQRKVGGQQA